MKRSSRIAVIAGIVFASTTSVRAEEPFRNLSFDEACKAANKEKKVVMIDFYTTWCGPCKLLDRTTWKDTKVQAWLKDKTVSIKVDAEKQRKLSKRYQIKAYPTILFLKPDGKKIDRLVGYRKADMFLKEAKSSLAGKTSLMRAKEALTGHEKDPMERMKYADALVREGRIEEALKEYLWCFDHGGENRPSFAGVRLSFLLSSIARMGRAYPPAIKALEKRRDAAEKKLLSAPTINDRIKSNQEENGAQWFLQPKYAMLAIDLSALNRELGRDKDTLRVYDEMARKGKGYGDLRKALFRQVLDLLLEARRYDDIARDAGDILKVIDDQIAQFRDTASDLADQSDLLKYLKHSTVTDGGKYYEALLGSGQPKNANKAAKRLIKFSPASETYVTLIKHAIRAGDDAAARSLAKRGLKSLPEKDREAVRMAIASADEETTNAP